MSADARRRALVSGGVAWATRMAQAVLSLGAAVVLARVLNPEAFGIFAMVVPVGVVSNQLAGQVIQTALLQRREFTQEEVSSFFWLSLRNNLWIAAGMVVAGVALAAFYREPRVIAVASAWAVITWLLTITTFQEALLKRALRFPVVMGAQFVGLVIGIVAAVCAAYRGAGYWSLPIQLLVMEVVRGVGVARASGWLPQRGHAGAGQATELRRSWRALAGFSLSTWLGDQPELMAVGRLGGAVPLGLYDTARRWARYPFEEPYLILGDLAVSGARVAGDAAAVARFLSRSVLATLTVSLPGIAFVGVSAPDLVPVVLGPQWTASVTLLRWLCIAAFASALCWLPLARGQSQQLLRWSVYVQLPVTLTAVLVGWWWGPTGVATSMAVASTLLVVPCAAVMSRAGGIAWRGLVGAAWRPVVTSLAAVAAVALADLGVAPVERLALAAMVFASAFLASWLALPGGVAQATAMARNLRTLATPG
jgi:polysaccharide transporter, PST family